MTKAEERLSKYKNVFTITYEGHKYPVYQVIEKQLKIETKEGQLIPFILNDDQINLYEEMCLMRMQNRPVRADILKARQIGFSTFIAGFIFTMVVFNAGQSAIIIADVAEHATNLFNKYLTFYENMDEELKKMLPTAKSNAKELSVLHGNRESKIRITVTGEGAGRSGTYQYAHLSECAFWKDLKPTLTALLQTVSDTNLNSAIFLETTANGVNEYKEKWDKDYGGNDKHPFKALFYPWYNVYRTNYLYDYDKPLWLRDLQEKLKLDEYQTLWYYEKWKQLDEDLDNLRQEYPSTPVEAFITTGNSVFNTELIHKRKEELLSIKPLRTGMFSFKKEYSLDGQRIEIKNFEWINSLHGSVKIYEDVIEGHPYVVANDPAMGGEDYFATQVFDNYTGKQVAVYYRNKCDIDDCVNQTYALGRYYNYAMITGETNTTSYLLEEIMKMGYPLIYQDQDVEALDTRFFNKLGYKTKQNNRNYMIDLFKLAFRDNPDCINDYETLCQMESFQIVRNQTGKEKAEATGGAHDDLVMAACGFYYCRYMQTTIPNVKVPKKTNSIDELEYKVEQNRKKINSNKVKGVYQIWD